MRPLLLALVLLVAPGCLANRRVAPSPETLRAERVARQTAYEAGRAAVAERLAARVTATDRTLDVLVLSGGGQHGAFGAGFLTGWAQRPGGLPAFDLVTGISTGALIAPFAFVGTPDALATVAGLYRDPASIAPRRDLVGALFRRTGGLFDTRRLVATVADVYDAALIGQMQRGFDDGRQLLIGTTDADFGRGRVWDVARESDTTASGVARLDRLLLASSAIPGAFPPVEIDGHVHIDGGIATNLLAGDLQFMRAFAAALRARGETAPVTVRLYVIVNLFLAPPVQTVNPASAPAVTARATLLLFTLHQQETVTRLWEVSEAVNAGIPGVHVEMYTAAVPDSWADEPGATELFDAAYMNRLQDYAEARARGPEPWDPLPPRPFE